MFIVYAKCRTCGDEVEIAAFDVKRDAEVYARERARRDKDITTHVAEEK